MGIGISGFSEIKTLKCKFFQICSIWGQIWVHIKDFQTRKLNLRVGSAILNFRHNKVFDFSIEISDISIQIFIFSTTILDFLLTFSSYGPCKSEMAA